MSVDVQTRLNSFVRSVIEWRGGVVEWPEHAEAGEALERYCTLAPDDETRRLIQLGDAFESARTAERRIEFCPQRLVDPSLPPPVTAPTRRKAAADLFGTKTGAKRREPNGVTPTGSPVRSTEKKIIRLFRFPPRTRRLTVPGRVSGCRAKLSGSSQPVASMAAATPGVWIGQARGVNGAPTSGP